MASAHISKMRTHESPKSGFLGGSQSKMPFFVCPDLKELCGQNHDPKQLLEHDNSSFVNRPIMISSIQHIQIHNETFFFKLIPYILGMCFSSTSFTFQIFHLARWYYIQCKSKERTPRFYPPISQNFLVKVLPASNMAHRAAPISVSITLGHTSAECSESYSRGLVHW